MPQAATNDIKPGFKLEIDAQPYLVVGNEFVKPGKGRSINRMKLKHLLTGRVVEKTFTSGEKLDLADVAETQMRLLYKEADKAIFMNDNSFEQIEIPLDQIEDVVKWLLDDTLYDVVFYNGEPVSVSPPTFMEMQLVEAAPGVRGDTSGRVLKPAKTESGASVQVPIFVEEGERIKIDTRTGEYVSRAN